MLDLKSKNSGRRTGLTRGGFSGASLLTTFKAPTLDNQSSMPPRTATASKAILRKQWKPISNLGANEENEHFITAPPIGSDNSSDDDNHMGDIAPSKFERGSDRTSSIKGGVGNGNAKKCQLSITGSKSTRSRGRAASPTRRPKGQKRKLQEEQSNIGQGHKDRIFDWADTAKRQKKTNIATYGSSSQRSGKTKSSQQVSSQQSTASCSPEVSFRRQPPVENTPQKSDTEGIDKFQKPDALFSDSPISTPVKSKKSTSGNSDDIQSPVSSFKIQRLFSPEKERQNQNDLFKSVSVDSSCGSAKANVDSLASNQNFEFQDTPSDDIDTTQMMAFQVYDDISELANKTREALADEDISFDWGQDSSSLRKEDDPLPIRNAACPMCDKPVNPDDLQSLGPMNTRMQEKFCRMHQMKDAEHEWKTKGYPEIDWSNFDSRISKHHALIKKLINGGSSYYRQDLEERVDAGKDRTLLKMTSSLTPGYYGSRGLRCISENLMATFTVQLKKRTPKDRLMSARGVTGFVQAVLVPEVASRLIMEDMHTTMEDARIILKDSVVVGELLSEELRDIARKKEDDSEEESEEDELAN